MEQHRASTPSKSFRPTVNLKYTSKNKKNKNRSQEKYCSTTKRTQSSIIPEAYSFREDVSVNKVERIWRRRI